MHDALGIKMRTAENHMAAAQLVDENAKFAHLPLPLVNAVAQAPEAMRPEIIGLVLDGTMMEATQVRDRVREKREADKRATALAKMSSKKRKSHLQREAEAKEQSEKWDREREQDAARARAIVEALRDKVGLDALRDVIAAYAECDKRKCTYRFWEAFKEIANPETPTVH